MDAYNCQNLKKLPLNLYILTFVIIPLYMCICIRMGLWSKSVERTLEEGCGRFGGQKSPYLERESNVVSGSHSMRTWEPGRWSSSRQDEQEAGTWRMRRAEKVGGLEGRSPEGTGPDHCIYCGPFQLLTPASLFFYKPVWVGLSATNSEGHTEEAIDRKGGAVGARGEQGHEINWSTV